MKAMPTGCHQGRGYWQNDDSDCTPPSARTEGCCFQAPRSAWPFSQQPTTDQASVQLTEKFTFTPCFTWSASLTHVPHQLPLRQPRFSTTYWSGLKSFIPDLCPKFKSFYKCTWGEHNPKQKSLWLQNTTKKTMSKFWLLSQVNLKLLLLNMNMF